MHLHLLGAKDRLTNGETTDQLPSGVPKHFTPSPLPDRLSEVLPHVQGKRNGLGEKEVNRLSEWLEVTTSGLQPPRPTEPRGTGNSSGLVPRPWRLEGLALGRFSTLKTLKFSKRWPPDLMGNYFVPWFHDLTGPRDQTTGVERRLS